MPLAIPPAVFVAGFREHLLKPGAPVTGMVFADQIELRIPEQDQQLFTPVLHLLIKTDTLVLGRFAPHPHLWMLVIALYFALAFIGTGGIVVALSLALVLKSAVPWALWLVAPAALALGGFIHGAVLIGQGLSAAQMQILRSFLEHVVDDKTTAVSAET